MTGIIVAGHGNFASGITSMLELVTGKPDHYEYIDFLQGESQEDLEEDYRGKLDQLKDCDKIVIMTDITGGSPVKSAVTYAFSDDSEAFIQSSMEAGKEQIKLFSKDML